MSLTQSTDPPPVVGVSSKNLTATGQSKYYVVIITSTRWGTVQAWMPDTVQMTVKSSWGSIVGNFESVFANWVGTGLISGTPGTIAFSKKLTAQAWKGVEPLQLVLQLHFFATEDASSEVIEPIKRLLKISLPTKANKSENSDFPWLLPPGPVAEGPWTLTEGRNQDQINVYLGNFLALKEVYIADIPIVEFSAKLSKDGLPMEGKCSVVFKTVYAPTAEDMETYLGIAPLGAPGFVTPGRPELR